MFFSFCWTNLVTISYCRACFMTLFDCLTDNWWCPSCHYLSMTCFSPSTLWLVVPCSRIQPCLRTMPLIFTSILCKSSFSFSSLSWSGSTYLTPSRFPIWTPDWMKILPLITTTTTGKEDVCALYVLLNNSIFQPMSLMSLLILALLLVIVNVNLYHLTGDSSFFFPCFVHKYKLVEINNPPHSLFHVPILLCYELILVILLFMSSWLWRIGIFPVRWTCSEGCGIVSPWGNCLNFVGYFLRKK